jgi:hypothetical protein
MRPGLQTWVQLVALTLVLWLILLSMIFALLGSGLSQKASLILGSMTHAASSTMIAAVAAPTKVTDSASHAPTLPIPKPQRDGAAAAAAGGGRHNIVSVRSSSALECQSVAFNITERQLLNAGPDAPIDEHYRSAFVPDGNPGLSFSRCKCLCSGSSACNSFTHNPVTGACALKMRCVGVSPLLVDRKVKQPEHSRTYYKMECSKTQSELDALKMCERGSIADICREMPAARASVPPAHCPHSSLTVVPDHRVIWSYWHSDTLPHGVSAVVFSWKSRNPSYTVRLLSARTVACYLPEDDFADIESIPLRADLIRLKLLFLYGGVWMDALNVLTVPLDKIIPWDNIMAHNGLFALFDPVYSNPGEKDFVESWMLAAKAGSHVMDLWSELLTRIVRANGGSVEGISTANIYADELVRTPHVKINTLLPGPGGPRWWREYLAICATYTYLYHHDQQFKRAVLSSSLERTDRIGYLLQLRYKWNMTAVNAVLIAPTGKHLAHQDLMASKVIKLSTNNQNALEVAGSFLQGVIGLAGGRFHRYYFQLVISRFDESLDWTVQYRGLRTVYNKGAPIPVDQRASSEEYVEIPNVGRESDSYLAYIINNYDLLPSYVAFTQAGLDPEYSWIRKDYGPGMFANMLAEAQRRGCSDAHSTDPLDLTSDWGFAFDGTRAKITRHTLTQRRFTTANFGHFFHHLLGLTAELDGRVLRFYPAGIFVVSKEQILSRSLSFYKNARRFLSYANAPVEGMFMERSWFYLLNCPEHPDALPPRLVGSQHN